MILGARVNAQQVGPQTTPPPAAQPAQTSPATSTAPPPSAPPASQPATGTPAPAAPAANGAPDSPSASAPAAEPIIVPLGTRLPLVLHNAITTRNAQPGDPVYLETLFPIVQNDKILIPAGSYVQGEILEAKRPGRVKGRGELRLRLTTIILPNGYTVSFVGVPNNAGTGGNESVDKEGTIKGDTNKGGDAGTVITDAGVGTAIGGIAGRSGEGAGIGAGVGLAAGLITVLLTRGPELELPRGTTLDVVLDRDLRLDPSKINFTDLGKASTLAGPPNREPQRSTWPF
jgi:type IV secretion system protein VirB10